jgi:cytochrome c peroxidase
MKKSLFIPAILLIFASCSGEPSGSADSKKNDAKPISEEDGKLLKRAQAYFQVLPEPRAFEGPVVELGKKLYYETALSINNELSCNSCHMLDKFGVDNLPTSPGHDGTLGGRNSPTVYNAYFHIAQFWDGRAEDLVEQAKGPILNPIEMGIHSEEMAIERIRERIEYDDMFKKAFPEQDEPITYQNIAVAIGAFEETLATPSKFDDYLKGDVTALTDIEKDGLKAFINNGCITCHIGPGLGGSMYQKFGLVKGPYWEYTESKTQDEGRYEVTQKEIDKYFFKVPSLRNIEKTAPYFHDGSVADLGDAVEIMAITQLGRELEKEETEKIVTFLKALTGEIPAHALQDKNKS